MKKVIIVLITGLVAGAAWCCVPPPNIEGVAFTSQETINLTKLTGMGTNGSNFLRDSTDAGIAVRYRSHYSNDAMVFVGSYGLAYQQSVNVNCMGIIADAEKFGSGTINKSAFDFAQAVKTELTWMSEQGIITIDNQTIAAFFDSLDKSGNGGVQYWTHQKHVLGYNSWYTKDSLSGVWNANGVDAVRSVKAAACAGINPEYKVFTQSLAVVPVTNLRAQSAPTYHITRTTAVSLTVSPGDNIDKVSIVNTSGKSFPIHTSTASGALIISWDKQFSPGMYFLQLARNATVQIVPLMIRR